MVDFLEFTYQVSLSKKKTTSSVTKKGAVLFVLWADSFKLAV